MFKPNVFGCLPSSGLKRWPSTRTYISYVIPDIRHKKKLVCSNWGGIVGPVISPSTILRLWNVCAEERTRQVKEECDGFSRRCFAGSDVWAGFECSAIRTAKFLTVSPMSQCLSSAQTFHKRRIVEGLMTQQFRPHRNPFYISFGNVQKPKYFGMKS